MFSFSFQPDLYRKDIPRMVMGGHGKIYSMEKDGVPYLEIEVGSNEWNPFNAECFFQQYFCIGNGSEVYFVDLQTQETKTVSCDMYFGYFHVCRDRLYVASSSRLLCFDSDCELIWRTDKIAVDGVIVDQFSEDTVSVSCELDPPGGWVQYQVSLNDGKVRIVCGDGSDS